MLKLVLRRGYKLLSYIGGCVNIKKEKQKLLLFFYFFCLNIKYIPVGAIIVAILDMIMVVIWGG